MSLEEQRLFHEDLERLEQAIVDRCTEEPKLIRDRLNRDHQIASFLDRAHSQTKRLYSIYKEDDASITKELQSISVGDPYDELFKQYTELKTFHRRYPNAPVENLERAYKRRAVGDDEIHSLEIDSMFTGEERYGRFFDLIALHEQYLNLPGIKGTRRMTYIQYLEAFDVFGPPAVPITRKDKMTNEYFQYLGALMTYLETFIKKTRPLENLDKLFAQITADFESAWDNNEVAGWEQDKSAPTKPQGSDAEWCDDCQKSFANANVYEHHFGSKKHIKAAEARKANGAKDTNGSARPVAAKGNAAQRLKEKAIADREFRIKKLALAMQTERSDTRVNVERKQGMTEREREQELLSLMQDDDEHMGGDDQGESDDEGNDKIYNPLKLPLAWDGKPIPFWLYKLHGLGLEFPCEICGNYVYMGRRAFEKHFSESRHIHGLKCLGITNTTLFREITSIPDAEKLWAKIQANKKTAPSSDNVVQMEDADGNVMPEKVYMDLKKQGLL